MQRIESHCFISDFSDSWNRLGRRQSFVHFGQHNLFFFQCRWRLFLTPKKNHHAGGQKKKRLFTLMPLIFWFFSSSWRWHSIFKLNDQIVHKSTKTHLAVWFCFCTVADLLLYCASLFATFQRKSSIMFLTKGFASSRRPRQTGSWKMFSYSEELHLLALRLTTLDRWRKNQVSVTPRPSLQLFIWFKSFLQFYVVFVVVVVSVSMLTSCRVVYTSF